MPLTIIILEISFCKVRCASLPGLLVLWTLLKKKIICDQMLKKTEEEASKRPNLTSRQLERHASLVPASLLCLRKPYTDQTKPPPRSLFCSSHLELILPRSVNCKGLPTTMNLLLPPLL